MCIVTNNYLICPGKHMQVIPDDIYIDDCMSYCEIFGHVVNIGCLNVSTGSNICIWVRISDS